MATNSSASFLLDLEAKLLRSVNRRVEPWLRWGLLSHELAPMSVVVIEVRGRRSGRVLHVPLLALRVRDYFIVTTVRRTRSQWIRNLASRGEGTVFLGGRSYGFRARVFGYDADAAPELPGDVRAMVSVLRGLWWLPGFAVAVLHVERGRSDEGRCVEWIGGLAPALARRQGIRFGSLPADSTGLGR